MLKRILSATKIIFFFIIILSSFLYADTKPHLFKEQPPTITNYIKEETRIKNTRELISIINMIDTTYGDLYANLENGKKLIIFFDPAHGKLPNGKWQGAVTGRKSCIGLPEEYYSMIISRRLYSLLEKNPFIEVRSTDDYMRVLKGESDSYKNIPFHKTVELASKSNAFIIISEHLNNVAMKHKGGGILNNPGLHVVIDHRGKHVLRFIDSSYNGFLTLYNQLDASGFSKNYAVKLKRMLIEAGLKPNSWEFGAVGDDRFTYFVDFPISIIYETGFISNPREEKNLRDPEHMEKIAQIQYDALIENIGAIFSIDISDNEVRPIDSNEKERIELLKLARFAVFYMQEGNTQKALNIIDEINNNYGNTKYKGYIQYFLEIKSKLTEAEKLYKKGLYHNRKKHYRTARRYFRSAQQTLPKAPVYYAYHKKYCRARGIRFRPELYSRSSAIARERYLPVKVNRAPLTRKIALAIDEGQDLRTALDNALKPDRETLDRLEQSFKNAVVTKWEKVRKYNEKGKRIWCWVKVEEKVDFKKGIYIVKINNKLKVVSAKKATWITLDPRMYQNQQYLKNSYFGPKQKHKSL